MPGNFKKEDLRIQKTHRALMDAMSKLLELRNFNQLTVNDLCEEARISRATFYFHFADKYDLLKRWLTIIQPTIINNTDTYEEIESIVNSFVQGNMKKIKNLLEDANAETCGILHNFLLALLGIDSKKAEHGHMDAKQIVLSKFCAGGVFNYLLWQVNNKFPAELLVMNRCFYETLAFLLKQYRE